MSTRSAAPGPDPAVSSTYVRRWPFDGGAAIVGVVIVIVSLLIARHGVSPLEEWVFRLFNDLPEALYRPMWGAQFLGLLLLPLAVAVVALMFRRWRLAIALALLVPAKLLVEHEVLKQLINRERPGTSICHEVLTCLNLRDVPWAGVSFPSGHVIIAFGIGWLVAPYLARRWQWVVLAVCLLVPVARMYLGAHNPLDVIAGGAAGIVIASLLNLVVGVPTHHSTDASN